MDKTCHVLKATVHYLKNEQKTSFIQLHLLSLICLFIIKLQISTVHFFIWTFVITFTLFEIIEIYLSWFHCQTKNIHFVLRSAHGIQLVYIFLIFMLWNVIMILRMRKLQAICHDDRTFYSNFVFVHGKKEIFSLYFGCLKHFVVLLSNFVLVLYPLILQNSLRSFISII